MNITFPQQPNSWPFNSNPGVVPNFPFPTAFPSNLTAQRPMKRQLNDPSYPLEFSPSEKKANYEKKIVDGFDGIRLGGDSLFNSPLINDPTAEENWDSEFLEVPETSDEGIVEEPIVEEPEEGTVELSDELRRYIQTMKTQPFWPKKQKSGNELTLFNRADEIKSRITEITDEDDLPDEIGVPEVSAPSSTSSSLDSSPPSEIMEVDESMEID